MKKIYRINYKLQIKINLYLQFNILIKFYNHLSQVSKSLNWLYNFTTRI